MTAARRSLDRGIACLLFGGAFACPGVGSTAARGVNGLLAIAGYRYGFRLS